MSIIIDNNILSKGWEYYDIMHKDRKVARIFEDGKCAVYFSSFMPYNLFFELAENIDERINNLNNFYYWCASRALTLDRKYAKEILNSIGAKQATTDKDRAMIALSYHCVCLMDVFWVRGAKEKISFEEVSLYRHSLSDIFVDISLRGKQITAQNAELYNSNDVAGDVSTPGVAPKAWVREENVFYLLKDGDERDVKAEILASKIVSCFNVPNVKYEYSVFDGTPVSKCKIITNEDKSIVSFEHINVYCTNKEMNVYQYVLKKDKYSYYMMNIVDYLIGNTDRHWGNWGFVVDNNNNKVQKLFPLMDFNKAFLSYETPDGAICQTTCKRLSQKEAAIEAVRKVGLNQISEIHPKWFTNEKTRKMFFARLDVLKKEK